MAKTRTFIDASILIAAARGTDEVSERAIEVLDDPGRFYVTSDFVQLEVMPKAVFNLQADEVEFYRTFFERADRTVKSSATLVAEAESEAERAGLAAIDALHIAAARRARCDELITAEKSTKPLFKVSGIAVHTIRPVS